MKKLRRNGKRVLLLALCLVLAITAFPLTALAAPVESAEPEQQETAGLAIQPMYSIDGKYQLTFRGYINGSFQNFFTLAIPCGYKDVVADYVWARDPKSPYGNNYGWLLRINGTVCSTIYGSSYGFPSGIPGLSITTSQFTGNYSFMKTHDMSGVKWTYRIPNTGNGNVTTSFTGSARQLNVSVPVLYVDRATGTTVATDNHKVTEYGTSTAYANAAKVPAGYVLDPISQSQVVTYLGSSADPSQIIFYVKRTAVEATLKVRHIYYDGPLDGTELEEMMILTGVGNHTILPTPGIVSPEYVLAPWSPASHTVTVNLDGTVSPNEVIFHYIHNY